jgi:hypothetical protein
MARLSRLVFEADEEDEDDAVYEVGEPIGVVGPRPAPAPLAAMPAAPVRIAAVVPDEASYQHVGRPQALEAPAYDHMPA